MIMGFRKISPELIRKAECDEKWNAEDNHIKNVKSPIEDKDAANKKYVDMKFKSLLLFVIFIGIVLIANISS